MNRLERASWLLAVCLALLAGLYFRLSGFYTWPLAVDEYYVYRSMTFILDSGLPQFPCGGYYTRGLVYQYLTVPLLYFDISPEAALRAVSIASNLLMLPAAYFLARRIGGTRIAATVLIVLALSTWEIEMSRFGRMYAPFQTLFMWYVYHAYCLATDRATIHWRWLFALSIIGPFIWEGAIVLSLFNIVPFLIDRKYGSTKHFVGSLIILVATVGYLMIDFRFLTLSSSKLSSVPTNTISVMNRIASFFDTLMPSIADSPLFTIIFVGLVALLITLIGRAVVRASLSASEIFVLVTSSIALITNQLLLTAFILAGARLVGWVRVHTLQIREVRHVAIMMSMLCFCFLLAAILGDYAPTIMSRIKVLIAFPDVLYTMLYPWLFNIPIMAVVLGALVALSALISLKNRDSKAYGLRLLIAFLLIAVAIIGIAPSPYHETRYSFFLYPLLICISMYAIESFSRQLPKWQHSLITIVPATFIFLFLTSSDFAIAHLVNIDSYDANYRVEYGDRRSRHYYPRADFKSPSDYVNMNAGDSDLVVFTSVVFAQYLNNPGFVYLDEVDRRYEVQVCDNGEIERWTNLPLLSSTSELSGAITSNEIRTSWIVVDQQTLEKLRWVKFLEYSSTIEMMYISPDNRTAVFRYSNNN